VIANKTKNIIFICPWLCTNTYTG